MRNYLDLLKETLETGIDKDSRAGPTRAVFGKTLRWDLQRGFPIITTRKMGIRVAFEETMMFLRGETDTKTLEAKNINIWKGNTSREFLDNNGLDYLPEGSLGTGYSHQWRNFGGDMGCQTPTGVDQVANLLTGLRKDPHGRRHIITGWNPQQLDSTPLPPCHLYQQYIVNGNRLDSTFVMRSNDLYHGLPFNIMGYALLNRFFAAAMGLESGELVYFGVDAHIYKTQIPVIVQQLEREPKPLPHLLIMKDVQTLDDILSLEFTDLELVNYEPHPALDRVPMAI